MSDTKISKRLFFALWPIDKTRQQIASQYRRLHQPQYKPVKTDNLHITLIFLGQVDNDTETKITQGANQISTPAFQLSFDQLSLWRRPGILCLTSQKQNPGLLSLVERLKKLSESCGIASESRPYKAHITLAKKAFVKPDTKIKSIVWQATTFSLVQSTNTSNGVHYQIIKTWPLLKNLPPI